MIRFAPSPSPRAISPLSRRPGEGRGVSEAGILLLEALLHESRTNAAGSPEAAERSCWKRYARACRRERLGSRKERLSRTFHAAFPRLTPVPASPPADSDVSIKTMRFESLIAGRIASGGRVDPIDTSAPNGETRSRFATNRLNRRDSQRRRREKATVGKEIDGFSHVVSRCTSS